jgi:hypothetical protein
MAKFFVSYSSKDKDFVENEIRRLVMALGAEAWVDSTDIPAGKNWELELSQGLKTCDWLILVMSENSARSDWVQDELSWAVDNLGNRIIPIKLDNCEVDKFGLRMRRIEYIDYSHDRTEAQTKLIKLLKDLISPQVRRTDVLRGVWTGMLDQPEGPWGQPLKLNSRLMLTSGRQELTGRLIIDHINPDEDITNTFKVNGVFSYERFVQLNYTSENPMMIQFGAMLCELDDTGRKMSGKLIGYGSISRKIISGSLEFSKEPEEAQ